ncbi:MAG: OB-fold nucleic acid binding domain-containing protein [Acidimicrobiia bacterium]
MFNRENRIHKIEETYGAQQCKDAVPRARGRFIGEVKTTRIVPKGESHWLEVVINDGTGKINGWFFGRKQIAGITLGSIILLEGFVQMDEGELTIANPYYEII